MQLDSSDDDDAPSLSAFVERGNSYLSHAHTHTHTHTHTLLLPVHTHTPSFSFPSPSSCNIYCTAYPDLHEQVKRLKDNGSPLVVVLASSAVRAVELRRLTNKDINK